MNWPRLMLAQAFCATARADRQRVKIGKEKCAAACFRRARHARERQEKLMQRNTYPIARDALVWSCWYAKTLQLSAAVDHNNDSWTHNNRASTALYHDAARAMKHPSVYDVAPESHNENPVGHISVPYWIHNYTAHARRRMVKALGPGAHTPPQDLLRNQKAIVAGASVPTES
eukprot:6201265-Pleurochrysis_carterae.AAC.6